MGWRAGAVKLGSMPITVCLFGDPTCPCQDGDACHYVDLPGSPAMTPPGRSTLLGIPEGATGVRFDDEPPDPRRSTT